MQSDIWHFLAILQQKMIPDLCSTVKSTVKCYFIGFWRRGYSRRKPVKRVINCWVCLAIFLYWWGKKITGVASVRDFPHAQQSQCQKAPNWTCGQPNLHSFPWPVVKTVVRQLLPCSLWRSTVEQRSSWSPAPCWRIWIPEGGCDLVGSSCWNRVLAGSVALWRKKPNLEQVCWQDLLPAGYTCWSSLFLKDSEPWKGPMLEQ